MNFLLYLSVLALQVSLFELKSALDDVRNVKRRRFKDVLLEAKKIAVDNNVDDYVNRMMGTEKRGNAKNERERDFMDLLEQYEVLMYARKLQTLLKQRSCTDWSCFDLKATNGTTSTASTPHVPIWAGATSDTTTPTTTPEEESKWSGWSLPKWSWPWRRGKGIREELDEEDEDGY